MKQGSPKILTDSDMDIEIGLELDCHTLSTHSPNWPIATTELRDMEIGIAVTFKVQIKLCVIFLVERRIYVNMCRDMDRDFLIPMLQTQLVHHSFARQSAYSASRLNLQIMQDLEYMVRNQASRKGKISLLKGVTGVLHPGIMTALVSSLSIMNSK